MFLSKELQWQVLPCLGQFSCLADPGDIWGWHLKRIKELKLVQAGGEPGESFGSGMYVTYENFFFYGGSRGVLGVVHIK